MSPVTTRKTFVIWTSLVRRREFRHVVATTIENADRAKRDGSFSASLGTGRRCGTAAQVGSCTCQRDLGRERVAGAAA